MFLKAVSGTILTLLLIGMLMLASNIHPVKADGIVYIKADRSVDPQQRLFNATAISTLLLTTFIIRSRLREEKRRTKVISRTKRGS